MANNLGLYNPLFYANEALIQLNKAMGMASRVHRGYDSERRSFGKGQTINIRRPGTFTAQDAPSTAQDLNPDTVSMSLDYWKEVKFKLTDRELAFTGEQIVTEHIAPAAVALADDIDSKLCGLYKDVPWFVDVASTAGPSDITATWKQQFDVKVPTYDAANMHYMVDSDFAMDLLNNPAFSQHQGAGPTGVETQRTGFLDRKFGYEFFTNQNVATHTKGTANTGTTALNGAASLGATTINIDAGTLTGTVVPGDTFVIAGNTQRYAITNTVTASGNAMTGVTFTPPLKQAHADNDVVTISLDNHSACLAFHRNAFALAMAPLSEMGNGVGAQIASVTDPITGLALRSRLFYVGDTSTVYIALDVLYGIKTLDPNLACRGRN